MTFGQVCVHFHTVRQVRICVLLSIQSVTKHNLSKILTAISILLVRTEYVRLYAVSCGAILIVMPHSTSRPTAPTSSGSGVGIARSMV